MVCNFSNIAFSIFGLPVYWYSLAYIFGIIIAQRLSISFSRHLIIKISPNLIDDFISVAIFGIVIGGRFGHVLLYDAGYYLRFPSEVFKVWHGGMSFYGGFLGIIAVAYWFCKKHRVDFLRFLDLWSVSVPVGLFFGRIANFINAELPGRATAIPWQVIFHDGVPRHPSQLYEAFFEGIVLFAVMLIAFYRQCHRQRGVLSGFFCVGYGLARFVCEFFREPDSEFSYKLLNASGLDLNQYVSMLMLLLGVVLLSKSRAVIPVEN
ncbi:MAG: prolipoprotein diacylglyceryl transferase [Holosporaceae bacterium]|nr:prolipoprotein diacylglyceryl transferase [Holosporaceae bacterium]